MSGNPTKVSELHSLVIMPCIHRYVDRYLMFRSLNAHGVESQVHSHNYDEAALQWPGEISFPRQGARAKEKWGDLSELVRRFRQKPGRLIVHDLIRPRGARFLRRRWTLKKNPRVRNVLSFYTPSADYFLNARWYAPGGMRVGVSEIPFYLKTSIEHVILDYVGVRMVDGIIGVTEQIVEGALRLYRLKDRQARLIPSCVDTDFWSPASTDETSRDCPRPFLLYVGYPIRRKGFHFLVDALARLRKTHKDLTLIVAGHIRMESGRDWYTEYIRSRQVSDAVTLLGNVERPRLRELYRNAVALVYPSLHEGSPRVVKEAASSGCPVVTFAIPGTHVVDPSGEFFRYCRSQDGDGVAERVDELLQRSDEAENASRLGRSRMLECFSPSSIARRTAAFYEELHRM